MKCATANNRFDLEALEPRLLLNGDLPIANPVPELTNASPLDPVSNSVTVASFHKDSVASAEDLFQGLEDTPLTTSSPSPTQPASERTDATASSQKTEVQVS